MHRRGIAGIVPGVLLLGLASSLSAGLYEPRQPTSPLVTEHGVRPQPWELFRDTLNDLLRIGDPLRPSRLRTQTLARRDALLKRGLGALGPVELAELGVLQLRLRETDAALQSLNLAYGKDPRNFWVLTHLGTLYQATGQVREAALYLETADSFFPSPWPGGQAAGAWFRQAERYQLSLLRSRLREGAGRTGSRGPAHDVDALFPVRFVGADGKYEAGRIAESERAKLPLDAVAIVEQLLIWFPADARLLWLLGELYNAQGDLASAYSVFEDCVGSRGYGSPTLREHRQIVKEALAAAQAAEAAAGETSAAPREALLPDRTTRWVVGGVFGVVVLLLGWWQAREIVRRVRAAAQRK